ncbi:MAG: HAD family hydrolase [Polyangiales bacterium]
MIFDLDGVLVDSELISCQATADLLGEHGVTMDEPEVRRLFLGKPIAAVHTHVREVHGRELPPDFGARKERIYADRARGTLQPFPGVRELLARLRAPVAIASSGSPGKVAFSLAETGLAPLFPVVCTTAEVSRGKPAPDLFLHAASKIGLPASECAVVEDAVAGIEAAVAAGSFAIGVTTSLSRDTLRAAGAEAVLDRIADLPTVLPHLFA